MVTEKDRRYMLRACALARRGAGLTRPNPCVGAVVVQGEQIVGEGYHQRAGGAHAEVFALGEAGERAQGGTLYVTLEPCNHFGRTPPCTEAILRSGVRRVVIGLLDPNPKVGGGGAERLRSEGLEVETGVLGKTARELNRGWERWVHTGRPFVTLKLALSLDGKLSRSKNVTTQITGGVAQAAVHRLRRRHDAILVGVNTVLVDDPQLTNRSGWGGQPLKVVADTHFRTPSSARLFQGDTPVLVAGSSDALAEKVAVDEANGERALPKNCERLALPTKEGRIDLEALLLELGKREIQSVLCEGGGVLGVELLRAGLVDRLVIHQAPLLLGGGSPEESFFHLLALSAPDLRLLPKKVSRLGKDLEIVYSIDG